MRRKLTATIGLAGILLAGTTAAAPAANAHAPGYCGKGGGAKTGTNYRSWHLDTLRLHNGKRMVTYKRYIVLDTRDLNSHLDVNVCG